jgi:hypothetical protein
VLLEEAPISSEFIKEMTLVRLKKKVTERQMANMLGLKNTVRIPKKKLLKP